MTVSTSSLTSSQKGQIGQQSLTVEELIGNAYAMMILFPTHDTKHLIQKSNDFEEHLEKLQADTDKAQREVDRFLETINLSPALKYWAKKACDHGKSAKRMMKWTIAATVAAVGSFVGLLAIFNELGWLAGSTDTLGLARFPLTLFAAAVTLWMPRAAYKLAVMHNHLKEHAEERRAIVHTYLTMLEHDPEFKADGRKALIEEDVKELVETVISDSWSFPDLRP